MAITREQQAVIARGPVALAARYDARRALIVISLEGGCQFSFPTALAEGLADVTSRTRSGRSYWLLLTHGGPLGFFAFA